MNTKILKSVGVLSSVEVDVFDRLMARFNQWDIQYIDHTEEDFYIHFDLIVICAPTLSSAKSIVAKLHVKHIPVVAAIHKLPSVTASSQIPTGCIDIVHLSEVDENMLHRRLFIALEKQQASHNFNTTSNRLEFLEKVSSNVIVLCDKEWSMLHVNEAGKRLFGQKRSRQKNRSLGLFFTDESLQAIISSMVTSDVVDCVMTLPSGEAIETSIVAKALSINRVEELYYVMITNRSASNKVRDRLIRESQLYTSARMAKIVAHEVRNPLTNMGLATSELKQESNNDDQQFYIEILERNIKRVDELIEQILQTTSARQLSLTSCSASEIVNKTLKLANDRITLRNVCIEKKMGRTKKIHADKGLLPIALLNIVINAIEAIPHDTPLLAISTKSNDGSVLIHIDDNGTGIQPEMKQKLFEPFQTGKSTGIGLGLTASLTIISAHGGDIDISDSPLGGARFSILLPEIISTQTGN